MHDAATLDRLLTDGGVPAGVIREVIDVVRDPFLDERGIAVPLKIAGLPDESVRTLGAPFKFSEDGPGFDAPPPWLGEHSAVVLREIGFTETEISSLVERRIIDLWRPARPPAA
jgi:crotonobetainyl-CoA:carnitine CoA-transferase CaiB-like acyl-CoA transferase